MWKAITCATLLALASCAASSTTVDPQPDANALIIRRVYYSHGPLEGEWTEKALPDGTFVKHGRSVYWYMDGTKCSEGDYVDGNEHGPWQYWWNDGLLRQKGRYEMGIVHRRGEWLSWDDRGYLYTTSYYFNDDDYVFREWWPSGAKREQYQCVNGKKDGTIRTWFANGQKEFVTQMLDGKAHGDSYAWDEAGNIVAHRVFADGELVKEDNEPPK
ncbi:MAG: hypothetical protein IT462_00975 [Planctomycetes bacterium]|nr:hypothetical protein [Planctomycetota bacterium]